MTTFIQAADPVAVLKQRVQQLGLLRPMDWFQHTIESGVLWLNTSLTFAGNDKDVLKAHEGYSCGIILLLLLLLLLL